MPNAGGLAGTYRALQLLRESALHNRPHVLGICDITAAPQERGAHTAIANSWISRLGFWSLSIAVTKSNSISLDQQQCFDRVAPELALVHLTHAGFPNMWAHLLA